ncbi:uncharacterized protein HMPREF1541_03058 [Cyphellophora europaea CBS 101466]|uniref:6-phosphogluconolactonase n=1 Tax=Cyphellophora europaea (strain CBS 101466) TaxID=1220924 RepID=W2RZC1_CYPE1|nr:uncharacterized protein HMPREF1541_03058 [Cyphellophora europaea CBS 101466]ETN41123.1 hypothetical protein HMPREF1541_03058 [Cyphellophora europaea CBS 101466]
MNLDSGTQPQWLTASRQRIYSISRTGYPDESSESGGVFAFQRSKHSHPPRPPLRLLSAGSSNGEGGVHCDVSKTGKAFAAANIEASTIAIYPVADDGSIGEATYREQYHLDKPGPGSNDSQIEAFPHQTQFDPTGRFLFVCARGADRLYIYSVPSPHQVTQLQEIVLPPGTGPRHAAFGVFNATNTYMYLVGELDNTIRVYTISYGNEPSKLTVELHQTISTLGPGLPPTEPNSEYLAADIVITDDGKFAYASSRGTTSLDSDTVAIYAIDDEASPEHHLTYLDSIETQGKIPRHLALSPDAESRYLAVLNEYTNDVVVFERDVETGLMKELKGTLHFGDPVYEARYGPSCILWR